MKHFCIVTNSYKDKDCLVAQKTAEYIVKCGGTCTIINNADDNTGEFKVIDNSQLPSKLECVITIGGDGTLLHVAKDLGTLDVLFIGINKGTLGFLAEIDLEKIEKSIDKLMNDEYKVESRMMLTGDVIRNGSSVYSSKVLNDVVVHRGSDLSISVFNVYVNNHLLGQFSADGIILSTPTGSTAYNLSAGGPVARPDSRMIILTPICSHAMGSRSILLSGSDVIEIEMGQCRKPGEEHRKLAFDGDGAFDVVSGDRIVVSEAKEITKIAKLDESSFLQVIKDKLA